MNSDLLKKEVESENTWSLADHRRNFGGPLLRPDTDLEQRQFFPFSHLTWDYHESTVGVALGSHMVERKRV